MIDSIGYLLSFTNLRATPRSSSAVVGAPSVCACSIEEYPVTASITTSTQMYLYWAHDYVIEHKTNRAHNLRPFHRDLHLHSVAI
jgi:hypothetical protein